MQSTPGTYCRFIPNLADTIFPKSAHKSSNLLVGRSHSKYVYSVWFHNIFGTSCNYSTNFLHALIYVASLVSILCTMSFAQNYYVSNQFSTSGLANFSSVAADANGNLYFGYTDSYTIKKATLSGSTYSSSIVNTTTFPGIYINNVAADGAGDVVYSGYDTSAAPAPGGVINYLVGPNSGTSFGGIPIYENDYGSIALSQNGSTLYASAEGFGGQASVWAFTGGVATEVLVIGVSSLAPGVNGSVYLLTQDPSTNNFEVLEESTSGNTYYTQTTIPINGLGSSHSGIASDSNGDIFIADSSNAELLELMPSSDGTFHQYVIATGFAASAITVDPNNNIYCMVPNGSTFQIYELSPSPTRIGYLDNTGVFWVKEGGLGTGFVQETSATATQIALSGDRIGYLDNAGVFWVKEGGLGTGFVQETSATATQIALSGDRIGYLDNTGVFWVKEGGLGTGFVQETSATATRGVLSGGN